MATLLAAQAVNAAFQDMSDYLEDVHEVTNAVMRARLIESGFKRLDNLHKKKDDFVRKACQNVRKHTGGTATRMVSMELEETLQHLHKWCQCTYLIQRPFDYDQATLVNIENVSHYVDQYNDGADTTATLDTYTDGIKKRV